MCRNITGQTVAKGEVAELLIFEVGLSAIFQMHFTARRPVVVSRAEASGTRSRSKPHPRGAAKSPAPPGGKRMLFDSFQRLPPLANDVEPSGLKRQVHIHPNSATSKILTADDRHRVSHVSKREQSPHAPPAKRESPRPVTLRPTNPRLP